MNRIYTTTGDIKLVLMITDNLCIFEDKVATYTHHNANSTVFGNIDYYSFHIGNDFCIERITSIENDRQVL